MGTFLSASAFTFWQTGTIPLEKWILMGIATLLVDMGTTGFNTFFDFHRGTDNATYTQEKEKVLVHEDINPISALIVSLILFALAAIIGLYLAFLTSWSLILFGGICMLVGFLYTGGPIPISRTPLGELFAGGFLGSALFLITLFVLDVPITFNALLLTIPFLVLIGMILSVNNGCDRIGDQANGRKTLSVLIGKEASIYLIAFEGFGAYALCIAYALIGFYSVWMAVFTLVLGFQFARQFKFLLREGMDEAHKARYMRLVSVWYRNFAISFILSCLLAAFL